LIEECQEDAELVLSRLSTRATELGGPDYLLAESLLNYCLTLRMWPGIVGYGRHAPSLLDALQLDLHSDRPKEAVHSGLGFQFFDLLLSPFLPTVKPGVADLLNELMENRASELAAMKDRCVREALTVCESDLAGEEMASAAKERIGGMQAEISELMQINKKTCQDILRRLTETPATWAVLLQLFISSSQASITVTALAALIGCGIAALRQRHACLRDSDWSLVYYARSAH